MGQVNWYFVENGERAGPVGATELQDMADHGVIGPDTLVWSDGMADWDMASVHFRFAAPVSGDAAPPPMPAVPVQDNMGFPLTTQGNGRSSAVGPDAPVSGGLGPDGLYPGAPSRGFGEAISVCFNKYATFSGRASRSEYWFFYLFTFLLNITLGLIPFVGFILMLGLFLPTLSVSVRRLHDTDRSGWWIGAFYIGMIGGLLVAGMLLGFAYGPDVPSDPPIFLTAIAAVVGLVAIGWGIMLFVFTLLKGTPGPNRFG